MQASDRLVDILQLVSIVGETQLYVYRISVSCVFYRTKAIVNACDRNCSNHSENTGKSRGWCGLVTYCLYDEMSHSKDYCIAMSCGQYLSGNVHNVKRSIVLNSSKWNLDTEQCFTQTCDLHTESSTLQLNHCNFMWAISERKCSQC